METKKRIFSIFLTLSILLMLLPVTVFADGDIWYVKTDGVGDGSSWANASSDLRDIMDNANPNDQVWVAAGTYTPGTNAGDTFTLNKGVKVYGGFSGGEMSLDARNWETNVTILSGGDTNYHVVTGQADAAYDDTLLDGFTITLGYASGGNHMNYENVGGGMYNNNSSPMVANCTFTGNRATYGAGMYNTGSSPAVVNCTFSGNSTTYGAGMYNTGSSPTVVNCTFSVNTATYDGGGMMNDQSDTRVESCTFTGNTGRSGGGMFNFNCSPRLTNCTFSGNTATDTGGGMLNRDNSHLTAVNCTFSSNTATNHGGGVFNYNNSSPTMVNTIVWNNTATNNNGSSDIYQNGATLTLNYCVVDLNKCTFKNHAVLDQTNLISTDPVLIPLDKNGNALPVYSNAWIFGLGQGSPAINAGLGVGETVNNAAIPNQDQRGVARPQGAGVDIGAFEAVFHTISYDGNGGEGSMTADNMIEGETFELPACTFTAPAGKLFMTWAIGSAGSATTADAGTTYTFTGNTTVYAVYRDSVSRLYAEWTKGSDTPASFTSDAELTDFLYVMVSDNVVDPGNYDATAGSTKIAFKADFLKTLSEGLHPVNIVSRTGITYGILKIKSPPAPPKTSVPRTGDGMGIYTLPALMLLSAGTIILLIRRRKASQK